MARHVGTTVRDYQCFWYRVGRFMSTNNLRNLKIWIWINYKLINYLIIWRKMGLCMLVNHSVYVTRDNIVRDIMSCGESVSPDILSIVYQLPKATSITSTAYGVTGVHGTSRRHAAQSVPTSLTYAWNLKCCRLVPRMAESWYLIINMASFVV